MRNIFVIWEEVPEGLSIYKMNLSDADEERVLKLHGKFANLTSTTEEEEKELSWLSDVLVQNDPIYKSDAESKQPYVSVPEASILVHSGVIM